MQIKSARRRTARRRMLLAAATTRETQASARGSEKRKLGYLYLLRYPHQYNCSKATRSPRSQQILLCLLIVVHYPPLLVSLRSFPDAVQHQRILEHDEDSPAHNTPSPLIAQ